jgi:hypothetical protein
MNSAYDLNMYIEDNWSQRAHLQVPLSALYTVLEFNIDIFGLDNNLTNNMKEATNSIHFDFCCWVRVAQSLVL